MVSIVIVVLAIALASILGVATYFYIDGISADANEKITMAKVANQGAQIRGAVNSYVSDNAGAVPANLETLVDTNYLQRDISGWFLQDGYAYRTDVTEEQCLELAKRMGLTEIPTCDNSSYGALPLACCYAPTSTVEEDKLNAVPAMAVVSGQTVVMPDIPPVGTSTYSFSIDNPSANILGLGYLSIAGDGFYLTDDTCSGRAVPGGQSCSVTVNAKRTATNMLVSNIEGNLSIPSSELGTSVIKFVTKPSPTQIMNTANGKTYNNGSVATSCYRYRYPIATSGFMYIGDTGSGIYRIAPISGQGEIAVYCDMDTDGGGWTRVVGISASNINHINSGGVAWDNGNPASGKGKLTDAQIHAIRTTTYSTAIGYRFTCGGVKSYISSSCAINSPLTTGVASGCTKFTKNFSFAPTFISATATDGCGLANWYTGVSSYVRTGPCAGNDVSSGRISYYKNKWNGPTTGCSVDFGDAQAGELWVGGHPPDKFGLQSDVALAFGSVNAGKTKDITITGVANEASTTTVVAPAEPFTVITNTCGVVAAGNTCTIIVRYAPLAVGSHSSILAITTGHGTGYSLDLTGTGSASFTTAEASLAYGVVNTSGSVITKTVSVTNPSGIPLTATLNAGQNQTVFSITGNTCSGVSNCTVSIAFDPDSTASFSQTLTLAASTFHQVNIPITGVGELLVPVITKGNGAKGWQDGTGAPSCYYYANPPAGYDKGTSSGVYEITVGSTAYKVYCDMATAGQGWTLVQSATFSGSTNVGSQVAELLAPTSAGWLSLTQVRAIVSSSSVVRVKGGIYTSTSTNAAALNAFVANSTWHNGSTWTGTGFNWYSGVTSQGASATGWPNMYHASGYGDGVHWFGTYGRTSGGGEAYSTWIGGAAALPSHAIASNPTTVAITATGSAGTFTGSKTITVTNNGSGVISLSVSKPAEFTTSGCTGGLGPLQACSMLISYSTTSATPVNGNISIASSAGDTLVLPTAVTHLERVSYSYTGSVQTITGATGTHTLKLWGAAGAAFPSGSILGYGGGYTVGTVVLAATDTLEIMVGGGGAVLNTTASTFGGGGGTKCASLGGGGQGGGRSQVKLNGTIILVAGGGGAANHGGFGGTGGHGGGTTGGTNQAGQGGGGATQSAGGAAGDYNGATAGSFLQGGLSGSDCGYFAGGGGGGYYGGGGANVGGGGGGSGYVNTSATTGGSTVAGAQANAANKTDSAYNGTAGNGTLANAGKGYPGLVVVEKQY